MDFMITGKGLRMTLICLRKIVIITMEGWKSRDPTCSIPTKKLSSAKWKKK